MRVIDLFIIETGVQAAPLRILDKPTSRDMLPVLRPSHSFRKLVVGFTLPSAVPPSKIFPSESLIVSTNGEGSHTYSYVIPYRFIPNSDVSVLIPRQEMSLERKLFYSLAITCCRWRFSYGRKPKGKKLEELELPALLSWIERMVVPDYEKEFDGLISLNKLGQLRYGDCIPLKGLFEIHYGNSYELNHLKPDPHGIAFVSRTSGNNGISGRVERTQEEPAPPGVITVALGGSVLETFLQDEPTYQGFHVAVLVPKNEMTVTEKLWYVTAIRQHKFRFSYGRQANRTLPDLMVPKYEQVQ